MTNFDSSSSSQPDRSQFKMTPSFKVILSALVCVNILNYLDRGVIPGASEEFDLFINNAGLTKDVDVYLGLLQSAFIIGYAIASVIFGNLIHYYSPFYLCTCGLIVWIIAVTGSGFSYYTGSYVCLFLARMLSGVGEAAYQVAIPPWIASYAPVDSRGIYLSIFYTAIPVGTAMGYAYSAAIAGSIGWQFAYFIEAILMACFIPFLLRIAPQFPCDSQKNQQQQQQERRGQVFTPLIGSDGDELEVPLNPTSSDEAGLLNDHNNNNNHNSNTPPTLLQEIKILLSSPVYVLTVMTYAAQTASLIGLSTFGSAFMIGLGFFNSETQSSTVFGVMISIAGIVSTPLGGYILDLYIARRHKELELSIDNRPLKKSLIDTMQLQTGAVLIGVTNFTGGCLLCVSFLLYNKVLYLSDWFFGTFSLFLSQSALNLVIMLSVPEQNRPLAVGLSNLGLHLFGDVPSPIIAGYIKDKLAPHCTGSSDASSSDACREEGHGLRVTMLLISMWLFVGVVCIVGVVLIVSRRWTRRWARELEQIALENGESMNSKLNYRPEYIESNHSDNGDNNSDEDRHSMHSF